MRHPSGLFLGLGRSESGPNHRVLHKSLLITDSRQRGRGASSFANNRTLPTVTQASTPSFVLSGWAFLRAEC
jgi:hypothetical protein